MQITCACGAKLRINDSAASKAIKCPKCGEQLQILQVEEDTPRDEFEDDSAPSEIAERRRRKPKHSNRLSILIGIVLVLLIVGGVAGGILGTMNWGEHRDKNWQFVPPTWPEPVVYKGLRGEKQVECMAWSPDCKLLATGLALSKEIKIWDVATGDLKYKMNSPSGSCTTLAFSPNGKLIASGGGGQLFLWDVGNSETRFRHHLKEGNPALGNVLLGFSPESDLLVSIREGVVVVVDVATRVVTMHPFASAWPTTAACSPAEPIIAVIRLITNQPVAAAISIYNFRKKEEERTFEVPFTAHQAVFSRDGKSLVVASTSGPIVVFDTQTWKEKARLDRKREKNFFGYDRVDITPDGSRCLAIGMYTGRPNPELWKVGEKATEPFIKDWCGRLAISPDGKTVACYLPMDGGGIRFFDIETGKEKSPKADES